MMYIEYFTFNDKEGINNLSNKLLVLESYLDGMHILLDLKTGQKSKIIVQEKIRDISKKDISIPFEDPLDLLLVCNTNSKKITKQDVDNIAKATIDALHTHKGKKEGLFHDDSQIIRLLVYKKELPDKQIFGKEISITISWRIHNPSKQMIYFEYIPNMVEARKRLIEEFNKKQRSDEVNV